MILKLIDGTEYVQRDATEVIAADLDARFDRWDVYRSSGDWVVTVRKGDQENRAANKSLLESMAEAQSFTPLPVIPKRPELFVGFYPVKNGQFWRASNGSLDAGIRVKTKKLAQKFIDEEIARNEESIREWDTEYALQVHGGAESVDFIFG